MALYGFQGARKGDKKEGKKEVPYNGAMVTC